MKLITKDNCPHCGAFHSWEPSSFKMETNWQKQLRICLCKDCTDRFLAVIKKPDSISHKGVNTQKYWVTLKNSVEKAIAKPKFV